MPIKCYQFREEKINKFRESIKGIFEIFNTKNGIFAVIPKGKGITDSQKGENRR